MSVFTLALCEVIEFHGEDNLGLDEYPVIDESYRERLNKKIIDQYLNREIGQESVSLWRHAMRRKMAQIMPVYNKLYATETLIIDPLRTIDLHTLTTDTREQVTTGETVAASNGSTEQESTTGSKSRQVSSDTPQVFLSGEGNYASAAADGRSDAVATATGSEQAENTTNTEATSNGSDIMDSRVTGFQGNQADLINAYRATILNIDMLIVNELEPLFMGLWNTGDSHFNNRRIY